MGAFATGFLVYGMALVYGTTGGELSYAGIAAKVPEAAKTPVFFFGEYFILIALGVQGRRGSVSHVDARCLRRRADAGHRVHGRWREGGGIRRHSSPAGDGVREHPGGLRFHRVGEHRGRAGRGDDDPGEPGGAAAGEHQAPVGVFVDWPRRLHPGRRRGDGVGRADGQAGGAVLFADVHLHDAGVIRRHRVDRQSERRASVRRRLGGRGGVAPGRGAGHDAVLAVARGRAADGRILRQVLSVSGRPR